MQLKTVVLLIISNTFMTVAWYGHLKYKQAPLFATIIVSWGHRVFRVYISGSSQPDRLELLQPHSTQDHAGMHNLNRVYSLRTAGLSRAITLEQPRLIRPAHRRRRIRLLAALT